MTTANKSTLPPLWATIMLVLVCGIGILAGFWQLDRAGEKRSLFTAFDDSANAEPLNGLMKNDLTLDFRYRRFSVFGRYDTEHQVLLDNMMYKGRPGYQVLTPLRIENKALLVNRGWIPADPDRRLLPELPLDDKARRVTGRLDLLPRPGFRLASTPSAVADPWPRRLLFPSAVEIAEQTGYDVYDYQLLLDQSNENGFTRDWRPAVMGAERHLGYAVQWFAIAVTTIIIYLVLYLKRKRA